MSTPEATAEFLEKINTSGSCPYLRAAPLEGDTFLSLAKRALLEGMTRLDALPRDDPFWDNTNHRSTIHKLPEFNRLLLSRDPGDERAAWCAVALGHMHSSGYFPADEWRKLRRIGHFDVSWPVHQAYYIAASLSEYASYRSCLSRDLAAFLTEEGLSAVAEPVLLALPLEVQKLADPPFVPMSPTDWAARVLHGLYDPKLWDGVAHVDALQDAFPTEAAALLALGPGADDADLAARLGWDSLRPGSAWGVDQQARFQDFFQGRILPGVEFAWDARHQRRLLVFASFAHARLMALWGAGELDEDAFYLGEDYIPRSLFDLE